MNHTQAVERKSPMRYVLGELEAGERDQFEEHMADCSNCMDEVWRATQFGANAREVFRAQAEERPAGRLARWFPWRPFPALAFSTALNVALAACLAFAVFNVYPSMKSQLARLNRAGAVAVVNVHGQVRDASGAPQTIPASGSHIVLSFDLPQRYESYTYSVADASGRVVSSGKTRGNFADSLNLMLPIGQLAPGEYKVTAAGLAGTQREELGSCLLKVGPN
jgi:hypothetical protein